MTNSLDRPLSPLFAAALLVASCGNGSHPQFSGPATCDGAADRLIEICDPFTGEGFRAECERENELFFPQHFQCLANLRACDEPHLDACGYRSLSPPVCDASRACDPPWTCDSDVGECVRCLHDDDCTPGRGCLLGLCFNLDTEFYTTFQEALGPVDAGTDG